ncbi:MAG TPA: hypothetical protein VGP07_02180 [Polyangia bacterium]
MVQGLRRAEVHLRLEERFDLARDQLDQPQTAELRADEVLPNRADGSTVSGGLREIRVDPPLEKSVDGAATVLRGSFFDSEADALLASLKLACKAPRLGLCLRVAWLLPPAAMRVLVPKIPAFILAERFGHDFLTVCRRAASRYVADCFLLFFANATTGLFGIASPRTDAQIADGSNRRSPPTRTHGSCPASARW